MQGEVEGPRRAPCQLKKPLKTPRLSQGKCWKEGKRKDPPCQRDDWFALSWQIEDYFTKIKVQNKTVSGHTWWLGSKWEPSTGSAQGWHRGFELSPRSLGLCSVASPWGPPTATTSWKGQKMKLGQHRFFYPFPAPWIPKCATFRIFPFSFLHFVVRSVRIGIWGGLCWMRFAINLM